MSEEDEYQPYEPGSPEDMEFFRSLYVGCYFHEKALRAGYIEPDYELDDELERTTGLPRRSGPDITRDLPALRQKLIDEYGVDPETIDPPEWYRPN